VGFDHYEVLAGQGPYYNPVLHDGRDSVTHTGYTQDIITDRALRWLGERATTGRGRSCCMLHYNAAHRYWDPGPGPARAVPRHAVRRAATFWDDGARPRLAFRLQEMEIARDLFARDLKLEPPVN
jgi:hypothetical protein